MFSLLASGTLALVSGQAAAGNGHHMAFEKALQDPMRPAEDRQRDAGRKPAEVMKVFGIKPGMKVLDLVASGGYYTEVISHKVGPKGEVLSHNNTFMLEVMDGRFDKEMTERLKNQRLSNVTRWHRESDDLGLDNEIDVATLVLNYHDFYNLDKDLRFAFLGEVKKALKPGGVFGVIDMQANPGEFNPKLHRINDEIVKREIVSAGFTLMEENSLLRNTTDDHTKLVFDPSVRGKTDRFILRFVK